MISDLQLRRDVLDELEFIPSVNAAHIAVSANCRVFNGSRSAIPSNAKQKSRMHMLRESIYSPSTPSPSLKSSLALRRERRSIAGFWLTTVLLPGSPRILPLSWSNMGWSSLVKPNFPV